MRVEQPKTVSVQQDSSQTQWCMSVILARRRLRHGNCELETCAVYVVSDRAARATEQDPVLKPNKQSPAFLSY